MKPIERYQYLKDYWQRHVEEAKEQLDLALKNYDHWSNRLYEAEMAEKLANDEYF